MNDIIRIGIQRRETMSYKPLATSSIQAAVRGFNVIHPHKTAYDSSKNFFDERFGLRFGQLYKTKLFPKKYGKPCKCFYFIYRTACKVREIYVTTDYKVLHDTTSQAKPFDAVDSVEYLHRKDREDTIERDPNWDVRTSQEDYEMTNL